MTTVSTVLALGMMPLNVWLYSRSWTDERLVIPYVNILISLAMTVTPAALGIFIRWKWEKFAQYIIKVTFKESVIQCTDNSLYTDTQYEDTTKFFKTLI